MTPERLSAAIDLWVWVDQQIRTYGPGLAAALAVHAAWRITRRTTGWISSRRDDRRGIRQLEHYVNHPANRAANRDKPRKDD